MGLRSCSISLVFVCVCVWIKENEADCFGKHHGAVFDPFSQPPEDKLKQTGTVV